MFVLFNCWLFQVVVTQIAVTSCISNWTNYEVQYCHISGKCGPIRDKYCYVGNSYCDFKYIFSQIREFLNMLGHILDKYSNIATITVSCEKFQGPCLKCEVLGIQF